ncbi:MAG: MOSC domain-containing protein [Candidatus Aureabacteria bacterium]|nr:MOSC domain-containing protein [Candidatus Auribacterota bacterium]
MGKIESINISKGKGGPKYPVAEARLIENRGIEGDGHGGPGPRQVSLLSWESALMMKNAGADIGFGSFGENITTSGLPSRGVGVGHRFTMGESAIIEVTAVGKNCPSPCSIFRRVGRCIMPDEGIFCKVVVGGVIRAGDAIHPLVRKAGNED